MRPDVAHAIAAGGKPGVWRTWYDMCEAETPTSDKHPERHMDIRTIGIIGAGQMGRGIAQIAAQAGIEVHLIDVDTSTAEAARARIEHDLSRLVERERLTAAERDATIARIQPTSTLESLRDADYAVEAVVEDLTTKRAVLAAVARVLPPHAILASNTSSISLTALAAATDRPRHVIGMHFMNPVPAMKLVEVIRAVQTDDAVHAATVLLAERLGKTVVSAHDMPGFIVNRMLIPFLNEACFALQDGVGSVEDIDNAARLGLNHPMGPFELADLIGLDTVLAISEVLHREFGDDKYRPPTMLRNYVAAGWLGRKTGRGFRTYT